MFKSLFFGFKTSRSSIELESFSSKELEEKMEGFTFKDNEIRGIIDLLQPVFAKYDIYVEDYPALHKALRTWLVDPDEGKTVEGNKVIATVFKSAKNLATVAKYWDEDYREFLATLIDQGYMSMKQYTAFNNEYTKKHGSNFALPRMVYAESETRSSANVLGRDYITIDYALIPYIKRAIDYDSLRPIVDDGIQDSDLSVYKGSRDVETLIEKYAACLDVYDIDIRELPVKVGTLKTIQTAVEWGNPFHSVDRAFKYYFLRNFTFWWRLVKFQRTFSKKVERKKNLAAYAEELKCIFELPTFPQAYNFFTTAHTYFDKYYASVFEEAVLESFINALKAELIEQAKAFGERQQEINAKALVRGALNRIRPYHRLGCRESALGNYSVCNSIDGQQLTLFNAVEQIAEGQLYAYLASFAAAGLLDLYYVNDKMSRQSVFWKCIKKVKLTRLGEYVLGLRHSYQPEHEVLSADPTLPPVLLDPKELIITANTEAALFFVRKGVGYRIGANRYLLDHETFVYRIANSKRLEEKIEKLRTLAEIERFPPMWQDAFNRMRQSLQAITPVARSLAYFQVDLSKDYVVNIFKTRKDVRDLIRMVEGGGFLVEGSKVDQLSERLSDYGISLPKPEMLTVTDTRSWRYRY